MTNKWDADYSKRADSFASTDHWQKEATAVVATTLPTYWAEEGLTPKVVVDLGCNSGALADVMIKNTTTSHISYIGIDPNTDGLQKLRDTINADAFKTVSTDTNMSGLQTSSADLVICLHAINQMEDWDKELEHVYRVLKPKGTLVIITHNVWWGKARRLQTILSSYTSDNTMVREPTKTQVVRKLKQDIGLKVTFAKYFDSVENPRQDWIASVLGNRLMVVAEK